MSVNNYETGSASSYSSSYRWYILALAALSHVFVCAMPRMCMPVLFDEIAEELGLNLVQIGTIWGMSSLAGILTGLAGGLVGDRYGVKRTLSVSCLLAGVVGALRGLSGGFTGLAVSSFFFGFLISTVSTNVHKAAGEWFPSQRLGVANGILSAGMGVGFMLGSMISATVLSPWLGGWGNVLFLYGAVSLVISFLWFLSKSATGQVGVSHPGSTVPLRQALSHVVRIKNVWLIALVRMFFSGCTVGLVGYLPLYLRGNGWTVASADGALAALTGASVVGVVPLSMLSDRLGLRKGVLYPVLLITIVSVALLTVVDGAIVWLLVILLGLFREGCVALQITMVMEMKEVGAAYVGTAIGITVTLMYLGCFMAPPLGNSLAGIAPSLPFAFWAAMAAAALVVFRFVRETGRKEV